jgi:hypothetical protein
LVEKACPFCECATRTLASGTFSSNQPLTIILGSDWLQNVGFGQLEELWADYLQHYAQQWDGMIIF